MLNVLILDDEPLLIETLTSTIDWRAYGMRVAHCSSSADAGLEYLKENPVDVVFTDIKMPGLGGVELLRRVHEVCIHTTFVMLSAWSDFALVRESFQYGATDYIQKIDLDNAGLMDELLRRVQERHRKYIYETPADHDPLKSGLTVPVEPAAFCQAAALGARQEYQLLGPVEELRKLRPDLQVRHVGGLVLAVLASGERERADLDGVLRQIPAGQFRFVRLGLGARSTSADESCRQAAIAAFYAADAETLRYETTPSRYQELLRQVTLSVWESGGIENITELMARIGEILAAARAELVPPQALCEDIYKLFGTLVTDLMQAPQDGYQVAADFAGGIRDFAELQNAVRNLGGALQNWLQTSGSSLLQQTKRYVLGHFSEPELSLGDVARALGVSSRYISSELYAWGKVHFKQYLNELRIKKAIALMENTTLRVSEICERSGYASSEHFSRVFSRQVGMSPILYIKKVRGNAEREEDL